MAWEKHAALSFIPSLPGFFLVSFSSSFIFNVAASPFLSMKTLF